MIHVRTYVVHDNLDCTMTSSNWPIKLLNFNLDFRAMLLINLIFEFCVVIVHAGCTPRAWLPSDLATSCLRHLVAKSLSNLALGV